MNEDKERKILGFALKVRIYTEMQNAGYTDINDYIDALKEQIIKLQTTNRIITKELQDANMKLDAAKQNEAKNEA